MNKLSERLKELRGEMSMVEAARHSGILQQAWVRLETEELSAPQNLAHIAKAFGVSADWLLGLTDERN